jgi:hypothetical protein
VPEQSFETRRLEVFFGAGQKAQRGGVVLASRDGLDWEVVYTDERKESPKTTRIYDIAAGDGLIFAGGGNTSHGGDSCFFYAENGRNWTEGSSFVTSRGGKDNNFGASVFSVAYGNGMYVAHGGAPAHGWYYQVASKDGKEWTTPDKKKSFSIGSIYQCCFGTDRFVGIGGHNRVTVSTDGENWRDADQDKVPPLISLGFADGKFIGGGMHGLLAHSTDGFEWTITNDNAIGEHIKSIIQTDKGIVAVGIEMTYLSKDGKTWTREATDVRPARVCYGDGRFIALNGRGTKIYHSKDAVNWQRGPDMSDHFINGGIIWVPDQSQ